MWYDQKRALLIKLRHFNDDTPLTACGFKGTVMQTEKELINDCLSVSKVS